MLLPQLRIELATLALQWNTMATDSPQQGHTEELRHLKRTKHSVWVLEVWSVVLVKRWVGLNKRLNSIASTTVLSSPIKECRWLKPTFLRLYCRRLQRQEIVTIYICNSTPLHSVQSFDFEGLQSKSYWNSARNTSHFVSLFQIWTWGAFFFFFATASLLAVLDVQHECFWPVCVCVRVCVRGLLYCRSSLQTFLMWR